MSVSRFVPQVRMPTAVMTIGDAVGLRPTGGHRHPTVFPAPHRKVSHAKMSITTPIQPTRLEQPPVPSNPSPSEPSIACPGLFYPTASQDGMITRFRIPGGCLNSLQALAVADFAEKYGDDNILITNRANLQIRSAAQSIPEAQYEYFQTIGLAAPTPQVDHLRNIMLSPLAGIDSQALIDARSIAKTIDQYISHNPNLTGLSAKFSIGIDGGESLSVRHRGNDIWLIAEDARHLRLIFSLSDRRELDTEIIFPIENTIEVIESIVQLYLENTPHHPSAQTQHRRSKKPRLHQILELPHLQNHPLVRAHCMRPQPAAPLEQIIPQQHLILYPPLGQLTHTQLRQIAQTTSHDGIRLTPWQTLILPNQTSIATSLPTQPPNLQPIACTGKRGCAAAETHSQTDAKTLTQRLQTLTLNSPITIHLSACAKACAHPYPSDIALLGTAPNSYEIYLQDSQQPFGHLLYPALPAPLALTQVEQMIHTYKTLAIPNESFQQFTQRFDLEQLRHLFNRVGG